MYLDDEPNSSKYSSSVYLGLFGVSGSSVQDVNVKMLMNVLTSHLRTWP